MSPRRSEVAGFPLVEAAAMLVVRGGRILAVYGWQLEDPDVPWHGGRCFIGGTVFTVEG